VTAEADATEFEALYRATRSAVLAYLLHRIADREDAADLLAEVYSVAWRRRTDRPTGSEARPWLFGVARRVLADHVRGQVRRRAAADGLRALLAEPAAPVSTAAAAAAVAREVAVHQALASLSELDRELIGLTLWDGLSASQAAQTVGISAGSARVRLHRARSRLRKHGALGELNHGTDVDIEPIRENRTPLVRMS
jgi:RNA polymerase sigma-70 factor (ECF subfamily)